MPKHESLQLGRIELAEHSKLINRRKVADIRKYNMERIDHALKTGGSLKVLKRKLGIGKNQMYALRDTEGNVTTNMDKIVKVAEEFYGDLYSGRVNQDDNRRRVSPEDIDIPPVMPETVKTFKALDAMQMCKAASGDQVTEDLLKDGGQRVLENLATLYTQCLMTSSMPESWQNADIILIHKKGDTKDLKN